jgi:hypothetical protein
MLDLVFFPSFKNDTKKKRQSPTKTPKRQEVPSKVFDICVGTFLEIDLAIFG